MSTLRLRVTLVILDVIDVIMSAPPDDPAWGLRICEATDRGPGTVYPALDRLLKAGWVEDRWEDPKSADRPPRRLYTVTSVGRAGYAAAIEKLTGRKLGPGAVRRGERVTRIPPKSPDDPDDSPPGQGDLKDMLHRMRQVDPAQSRRYRPRSTEAKSLVQAATAYAALTAARRKRRSNALAISP